MGTQSKTLNLMLAAGAALAASTHVGAFLGGAGGKLGPMQLDPDPSGTGGSATLDNEQVLHTQIRQVTEEIDKDFTTREQVWAKVMGEKRTAMTDTEKHDYEQAEKRGTMNEQRLNLLMQRLELHKKRGSVVASLAKSSGGDAGSGQRSQARAAQGNGGSVATTELDVRERRIFARADYDAFNQRRMVQDRLNDEEVEYRDAIFSMMRSVANNTGTAPDAQAVLQRTMGTPEARALSSAIGAQGGFLAPRSVSSQVDVAMSAYGGILDAPTNKIDTDDGNPYLLPTINSVARRGRRVEPGKVIPQVDPNMYGVEELGAYMYTSDWVLVPVAMLQDVPQVERHLVQAGAEALGRVLNDDLTNGDGVNKPRGIVDFAVQRNSRVTTTSSTILFPALNAFVGDLDPAYFADPSCAWQMHNLTAIAVQGMLDGEGRPLWLPSVSGTLENAGQQPRLFRKPVYINQDLAPLAAANANRTTFLLGAMNRYNIRRVRTLAMVVARERFIDQGCIGIMLWMRADGCGVNKAANPIVKMLNNT